MATLTTLSTEYLNYQVFSSTLTGPVDPTADVVQFAFPATGVAPVTWYAGSWESSGNTHVARCLVGPVGGALTFTAAVYDVWLKVTDSPEVPARLVGTLTVS